MTDAKEAYDDLEEMLKEFRKDPYAKYFSDERMVWLITMWLKVAVAAKGDGMYSPLKLQFLKNGNPGKPSTKDPTLTWKDEAYIDLKAFEGAMSMNKDNPNPHKFDDATNAVVSLAQYHRNRYKRDSKEDKAFENRLRTALLKLDKEVAAGR